MKPATKALLVVFGTVAFFLIPVIGPAASSAGNWLVQRALGVDDESAEAERKLPIYRETPLDHALNCCTDKCGLDWNYFQDRCTLDTRADSACYQACGAVAEPTVPGVISLPRQGR